MKLLCGLQQQKQASVATIGNYDGMHLGHQKILTMVKAKALEMNLPSLVIIFEPQPSEFFLKECSYPRLTTLRQKLEILREWQIDIVVCIRFDAKFAAFSAKQFIEQVLIETLQVKHIIIGDDFSFGHNRIGGFPLLQEYAKSGYLQVAMIPTVQINGMRVSSSNIRQALAMGDFTLAKLLLGRPYSITGRVIHGEKLGSKLGFPTANIYLRQKILPISGVHVVKVRGLGAEAVLGAANLGKRPTIDGGENILEVHLLNFNKDIYGQRIEVEFMHKIRDEQKFASFSLLKQQIAQDVKKARQYGN